MPSYMQAFGNEDLWEVTGLLQAAERYAETATAVTSYVNAVKHWAIPLDRLQKVLCSVGPVSGWTVDTVQLLVAMLRTCTALIKHCKVSSAEKTVIMEHRKKCFLQSLVQGAKF